MGATGASHDNFDQIIAYSNVSTRVCFGGFRGSWLLVTLMLEGMRLRGVGPERVPLPPVALEPVREQKRLDSCGMIRDISGRKIQNITGSGAQES